VSPEQLSDYALAKPGAWADQPWGEAGANRDEADEWLARFPEDVWDGR